MKYDRKEENQITCPACSNTDSVKEISEDEKDYGLGLYSIYDFIGRIDLITCKYHCEKCGYKW